MNKLSINQLMARLQSLQLQRRALLLQPANNPRIKSMRIKVLDSKIKTISQELKKRQPKRIGLKQQSAVQTMSLKAFETEQPKLQFQPSTPRTPLNLPPEVIRTVNSVRPLEYMINLPNVDPTTTFQAEEEIEALDVVEPQSDDFMDNAMVFIEDNWMLLAVGLGLGVFLLKPKKKTRSNPKRRKSTKRKARKNKRRRGNYRH